MNNQFKNPYLHVISEGRPNIFRYFKLITEGPDEPEFEELDARDFDDEEILEGKPLQNIQGDSQNDLNVAL